MTKKKNSKKQLKGTKLAYNAADQAKYKSQLESLVKPMTEETKNLVLNLFNENTQDYFFAKNADQLLNKLSRRWETIFSEVAPISAKSMVENAKLASENALNISIKNLSKELSINTGIIPSRMETKIQALISENVSLIKSIPQEYFTDVHGQVMRSITNGTGVTQLKEYLQDYKGITERRAKNIALDQTRKAYNTINSSRMQAVGFKKFEWLHSGGGLKPRKDHVAMHGNIYSFDDLPVIDKNTGETGIPGQAINCRCTLKPVYEFED